MNTHHLEGWGSTNKSSVCRQTRCKKSLKPSSPWWICIHMVVLKIEIKFHRLGVSSSCFSSWLNDDVTHWEYSSAFPKLQSWNEADVMEEGTVFFLARSINIGSMSTPEQCSDGGTSSSTFFSEEEPPLFGFAIASARANDKSPSLHPKSQYLQILLESSILSRFCGRFSVLEESLSLGHSTLDEWKSPRKYASIPFWFNTSSRFWGGLKA